MQASYPEQCQHLCLLRPALPATQVPFDKPMLPTGNVEVWLAEVERRMKSSVRTQVGVGGVCLVASARRASGFLTRHDQHPCPPVPDLPLGLWLQIIAAMHAYPTRPRTAWVREWPAMVVLAVSQIFWASRVEEALTQGTVQVSSTHTRSVLLQELALAHALLARINSTCVCPAGAA